MPYKVFFNELKKIEQASIEQESSTKHAFNIFTILRKYDEEVGLHSKFLAEILNPQGSHAMPVFQQIFIDEVINPAIDAQEWQQKPLDSNVLYDCETEILIRGFGRVDIILKSSDNVIVIENKIHASDQKNQLQRYFEACNKLGYSPKNIYILYLNKDGVQVTAHGKGNLRDDQFGQINYKDDISHWLDLCIKEAKNYPHIEQTLKQYGRLIGSLTGDNRSAKMKKSHVDFLYKDNNFELAYDLSQSLTSFQVDLQNKIWKLLLVAFQKKGYIFKFCDKDLQSCDENRKVKNYYKNESRKNRFYGIQCEIGTLDNYKVHCFIQLNHNIYYGVSISFDGKRIQYPDESISLSQQIAITYPDLIDSGKKWFLGGHILPSSPLNFKKVNSIYKVTEKNARDKWVDNTVNEIVFFIDNVKALELISD
ncbi:PD-(D/E)XK nuclease family protein [Psychrobacter urativorans]|uniref:PDDEXK-like family protein n=1 Tax=Psychrobacter urativorans TaxID=45610 RepID=UPI001919FF0E|nr:PD-(D/E)XK nuclease family protein [Psychrobacter urativorans]